MTQTFFPKRPDVNPTVFICAQKENRNLIKVGYSVGAIPSEIREQFDIKDEYYALRKDGTICYAEDMELELFRKGVRKNEDGWFVIADNLGGSNQLRSATTSALQKTSRGNRTLGTLVHYLPRICLLRLLYLVCIFLINTCK